MFTLGNIVSAQFVPNEHNCNLITKEINDKARNITRIVSKEEIRINDLGGWGLYHIVLMRSHEDFSFILRKVGKECIDKDTPVTFYFRDGSKLTFISTNKDNCEGAIIVSMGGIYGNGNKIQNFLNSYLIGIEFKSKDGNPYRLKIETPNTELIKETFECMAVAY